jgi:hypothetical protein
MRTPVQIRNSRIIPTVGLVVSVICVSVVAADRVLSSFWESVLFILGPLGVLYSLSQLITSISNYLELDEHGLTLVRMWGVRLPLAWRRLGQIQAKRKMLRKWIRLSLCDAQSDIYDAREQIVVTFIERNGGELLIPCYGRNTEDLVNELNRWREESAAEQRPEN